MDENAPPANSSEKRPLNAENVSEPPTKKVKPNPLERKVNDEENLQTWTHARDAAPILYDFLFAERVEFPSYDVIWIDDPRLQKQAGSLVTSRSTNASYNKSKHIWKGEPHAVEICNIDLPAPLRFPSENLGEFIPPLTASKNIPRKKRMIHPGPVTRIKSMPQFPHTIATHTRHKYTFLWNIATQHDREDLAPNSDPNTPLLILKGHRENASRALDFNTQCYFVCSGGKDTRICVWGIDDYETSLSVTDEPNSDFVPLSKPSPKLKPACVFRGHEAEVTEVLFHPENMTSLCSVSAAGNLLYWDIRSGAKYTGQIQNLHCKGLTTLAWNRFKADLYVVTGGADGVVKLVDIRMFKEVATFSGHKDAVTSITWGPHENYFMTSSQDHAVTIWDVKQVNTVEQVFFRHSLHKGPVVTAAWSKKSGQSSWDICSTATVKDEQTGVDKGELHVWRPTQLLTNTKEALRKIEID